MVSFTIRGHTGSPIYKNMPEAQSPGPFVIDFLTSKLPEKKCAIYNVPSNFFYSS